MKTFELLHKGDSKVIEIYKDAHTMWGKVFKKEWDVTSLSNDLAPLQLKFEHALSSYGLDRWEGQEIFVISGLTFFENEINSKKNEAYKISQAFELSWCSLEVKGLSQRFSKALYIGSY
ncbi:MULTISPECIES: hypothetical protein [Serratia]|uniref:hypothetical protein n=1 Tax=Serratia TaxID=613 RepID=UPI0012B593C1|nr:hypothetical protein [Serratia marcescens]